MPTPTREVHKMGADQEPQTRPRLWYLYKLKALHERAKAGDKTAARKLIRACRRGMLVPDWETDPPKITDETIEKFLERRAKPVGW